MFNQFAVHSWFENLDRGEGEAKDYIHIHFLPARVKRGWAWQIPITDTITSVGVVAEKEIFVEGKYDQEGWFNDLAASNENLAHALRDAKPVKPFKSEADYSYVMSRFVGDGYMLIGDAARFVDPIFSSGVSVALESAKMASETIQKALAEGDVSRETLMAYETQMRSGVEVWYEFIKVYYKCLPLFTYFIQNKEYRLGLLQLLQGEVFNRDAVPVLDKMRAYVESIESADNHMLKPQLAEDIVI